MTARRKTDEPELPRRPPATSPDARENELIALATDAAERQIREGTASSQVITHYLKLGSSREALEQERLRREVEVLEKKVEEMASARRVEELMSEAIEAFRSYSGQDPEEDPFDD